MEKYFKILYELIIIALSINGFILLVKMPFQILRFILDILFGSIKRREEKRIKEKKDKAGKEFENEIVNIIRILPCCEKLLANCYLKKGITKKGEAKVTEVDIIVFTKKCLIVIETKHFSGNIKRDIDDRKLIFESENGGSRESQNPIKQNHGHISFIKRIIGKKIPIVSLIVFSNKANISTLNNNERDVFICKKNSLEETIEKILIQNNKEIDISVLNKAYEKLSKSNGRVTEQDKKEHLKYAQKKANNE